MKVLFMLLACFINFSASGVYAGSSAPIHCRHVATAGEVACFAHAASSQTGAPLVSVQPSGYGPAQFHTAYTIPSRAMQPTTVAIVGAYHAPTIRQDLHAYDTAYGIPDPPQLRQLSQRGDERFPAIDPGWALEMSMDVETIHQTCQNCSLLLVEADSPSLPDLMAAVRTAISHGATVVSNSYGAPEVRTDATFDTALQKPGVTIVVSSGDSGYGVEYPAASPGVVAAGGTSLRLNASGHRLSETAWIKGGSGCSRFMAKPAWQHDNCAGRSVADVAADADPATGAAIYDSTAYQGRKGWYVLGGTSLSAPLIAGMYGLAGGDSGPRSLYQHGASLYDVVAGSNGGCRSYLCKAGLGYDGPSGFGSPSGLAAFR